ncbi:histidinol dehydrogenase [Streptomyces sp. YIM 98790]|uniref:histidinol dehydrogenase n=1 Tax=Streptomyces sp. YIM 98790 TaxID=2689077 RepID=UPI00140981C6|nr:histidinol dehydrogenase [Streptomyces sp. YIM 98790]
MGTKINRYTLSELSPEARRSLLVRAQGDFESVRERTQEIIDEVRARGDEALIDYAEKFDGARLTVEGLKATEEEFAEAERLIEPSLRSAIEQAVENIRAHHEAQLPTMTWMKEHSPGVISGERILPIASAALYVPRGKGSFPSVMMMLAVPATLAGVPRVVACTPPGPDGSIDAATLVAARLCGVRDIYKTGGAQAVAAFAFGTGAVERVEKIVGPGNQFVSAAKRLLYGQIDPGTPAGPSESVVMCDAQADPEIVAREWLVEAEHGPDSAAMLVTDSAELADRVEKLVPGLLARLPEKRRSFCETVLSGFGGIVLTSGLDESVDFVNDYAPEHLRVIVDRPFEVLNRLQNAGEVLLGEYASIPYGNFAIGVNAILPTGGSARSYSCVGVDDFLKRSSFAYVSAEGARKLGPIAVELARYEGFPSHAEAAQYTLDRAQD